MDQPFDYDYIIIGSGFGGAVAALRLSEKGYRVLVLEKGKWLREADFPETNWNVKKWLWMPFFRFFGLFRLTLFRHVAVLSGVGVGGGSLVYANTMPIPKKEFFVSGSWAGLADWEEELREFYPLALKMRGATVCPRLETGDLALRQLAMEIGKADGFMPTTAGVYFGKPGETVPDPYFDGKGPDRTGCVFCGGCMLGCRFNSKNTLDKNYLHLAMGQGAEIRAESEACDVAPLDGKDGTGGYRVKWKSSTRIFNRIFKKQGEFTSRGVVFAGGVLGTVKLLLKLKSASLPRLSQKVGCGVRTNSESLIGVTTTDRDTVFSDGVAISAILNTDAHSHLETVRYSAGSGIWRLLMSPMISGGNIVSRVFKVIFDLVRHPVSNFKAFTVSDWSKKTQILLFMRSIDSTLRLTRGFFGLSSRMDKGEPPTAFIPESRDLAEKYAAIVNGKPMVLLTETFFGIPTTAHILGGAVMGKNAAEGVIDRDNRVFGYENMYVCDGSMISANIGVNPSLTITAISERAMGKIPVKQGV
ncbi:MAG: GMC family oxidoreductase [Desulfobacteraceae bacterium]|nr:MAG: GMC family oxidoreductase [Desulfobacteraceae bacterium]